MSEESTKTVPPAATAGSNLSIDGSFMTIRTFGWAMIGEPTGSSETITEQLQVPPRISGPYDGSPESSLPSMSAACASTLPEKSSPCPPKPAIIVSYVILKSPF